MSETAVKIFEINTAQIDGWNSFHHYFAKHFGFPDYYGKNMNAWIDCMTYIDDPDECHPVIPVMPGDNIVLKLIDGKKLKARHPEIFEAILECSAFVNIRRLEESDSTMLTVAVS